MSKNHLATNDRQDISQALKSHKESIDSQLKCYSDDLLATTAEQFGDYPAEAVRAFVAVLSRGGKRIRGSLVMVAYEMFGGTDKSLILQAACAIEILNTYILVADDIQDRSDIRRGGKTAHILLRDYHQTNHLSGDAQHFGESIAINAFLVAQHYAMNLLTSLDAPADLKIKAIDNINKSFITTAHGQTLDIFSEVLPSVSEQQINNVLEWKTAYYTFINPLQLGAILAGASAKDLEQLAHYGLQAGRAFQLSDDMLGTFGKEADSGKSPLDDMKEGKRTMLTTYALAHAAHADALYLERSLGDQSLDMAKFNRCKEILINSGAREYVQKQLIKATEQAAVVVKKNHHWPEKSRQFLLGLVQYIVDRKS